MKISKPWLYTLIIVWLLLLAYFFYVLPSVKVATAYASKYVCSATFISGLNSKIIDADLDFFPVNKVKYTINKKDKYVEGTLYGMGKQRAYFYQDDDLCGCNLNINEDIRQKEFDEPIDSPLFLDTIDWPFGDRIKDTVLPGINIQKIKQVINETMNTNKAARAIVVNYKDFLVAEEYASGINRNTRLLGWSMTKTISNALIGNLVKNGSIDIEEAAPIPQWKFDKRKNITINNLLQMSSGLEWVEDYGKVSNVTQMLFLERDLANYAISSPYFANPNDNWVYSSGTTNILSHIIKTSFTNENDYRNYPKDSLFNAIGMRSAVVEMDDAGTYVFSSYCWATARDWTRFGLLYLNKGMANNHQVFTPEWAEYTISPAPSSEGRYGAQIWLNKSQLEMPGAPPDAFYEDGYGGQRVLVIPSKELVVVLLSGKEKDFSYDNFISRILDCFE